MKHLTTTTDKEAPEVLELMRVFFGKDRKHAGKEATS